MAEPDYDDLIKKVESQISRIDELEKTIKDETQRDKLIYDVVEKMYQSEWDRLRSIDNKAGNIVGFISVAVGFLLGTVTLGLSDVNNLHYGVATIFLLGVGVLILAIGFGLYAMKVRSWDILDVNHLLSEYTKKQYKTAIRSIAATLGDSIKNMVDEINRKANLLKYAWITTIIGLVIVFIFLIVAIVVGISIEATGEK